MGESVLQTSFGFSDYYDTRNAIHRFDPRTRLVAVLLWLTAMTATASMPGLGFGFLLVWMLLMQSGTPVPLILRQITRPLVFISLLVLLQILFSPFSSGVDVWLKWGPVLVNAVGVTNGIKLLLRFSSLYLLLSWMTVVLSSSEIIRTVARFLQPLQRLGIPTHDVVLLIQVTLHFLPLLTAELERIAKAQASRGAEWGIRKGRLIQRAKQTFPILLPLFINSLHRAENLAQAIEARGYGSGTRTSLVELKYSHLDIVGYAAIILTGAIIVML
jgi:energy-coupling factor transport system permease protein